MKTFSKQLNKLLEQQEQLLSRYNEVKGKPGFEEETYDLEDKLYDLDERLEKIEALSERY